MSTQRLVLTNLPYTYINPSTIQKIVITREGDNNDLVAYIKIVGESFTVRNTTAQTEEEFIALLANKLGFEAEVIEL